MKWPFQKRPLTAVEPIKPQDAYALWAPGYPPRPHNRLMEVEQAAVVALLPELAGREALDAGCGTGRYLRVLADRGATVIGVDLSAPMLMHAHASSRRVVRGCLTTLPLASRSIDVIVCGLALGDVEDLARAINEMARVLRPGGVLIYSVVHPQGETRRWSRTFEADGRQCAVAGFWHSEDQHRGACAIAGLAIDAWQEPHLGDPRRPVALVVRARVGGGLVEARR